MLMIYYYYLSNFILLLSIFGTNGETFKNIFMQYADLNNTSYKKRKESILSK